MDLAGLPSRAAARLARGRAMDEALMPSLVTVHRPLGKIPDPDDPEYEINGWAVIDTDVPFRLHDPGGSRGVTIGAAVFEQADGVGSLPATFADLADNDRLEITAGEWTGSVYRVEKAVKAHQATARRVPVVEATRPAEWA